MIPSSRKGRNSNELRPFFFCLSIRELARVSILYPFLKTGRLFTGKMKRGYQNAPGVTGANNREGRPSRLRLSLLDRPIAVDERRVSPPGAEGVNPDPPALEVGRPAPRERPHGGLAGAVDAQGGKPFG